MKTRLLRRIHRPTQGSRRRRVVVRHPGVGRMLLERAPDLLNLSERLLGRTRVIYYPIGGVFAFRSEIPEPPHERQNRLRSTLAGGRVVVCRFA